MIGLSFVKDISIFYKDKGKSRILVIARCENDHLANSSKMQYRRSNHIGAAGKTGPRNLTWQHQPRSNANRSTSRMVLFFSNLVAPMWPNIIVIDNNEPGISSNTWHGQGMYGAQRKNDAKQICRGIHSSHSQPKNICIHTHMERIKGTCDQQQRWIITVGGWPWGVCPSYAGWPSRLVILSTCQPSSEVQNDGRHHTCCVIVRNRKAKMSHRAIQRRHNRIALPRVAVTTMEIALPEGKWRGETGRGSWRTRLHSPAPTM